MPSIIGKNDYCEMDYEHLDHELDFEMENGISSWDRDEMELPPLMEYAQPIEHLTIPNADATFLRGVRDDDPNPEGGVFLSKAYHQSHLQHTS